MTHRHDAARHRRRAFLLALLAAAAAPGAAALAQPGAPQREVTAPSGSQMEQRGQQEGTVSADQLRTVERSLRDTAEQLANTPAGTAPNIDRARTAVVAGQAVLARIPQDRRAAADFLRAQEQLAEARRELEAPQLNQAEAVGRLRAATSAVAALSQAVGGGPTEATRAVGGGGGGR